MALTPNELIDVLKFVGKKTPVPGVGWAIAAVTVLYKHGNAVVQEKLDATRKNEGCPHIGVIDGLRDATNNMFAYMTDNEGLAWQSLDGNLSWYYHVQADFQPLDFVEGYYKDENGKINHRTKSSKELTCKQCLEILKQRGY